MQSEEYQLHFTKSGDFQSKYNQRCNELQIKYSRDPIAKLDLRYHRTTERGSRTGQCAKAGSKCHTIVHTF